jgi:hypothetical protein
MVQHRIGQWVAGGSPPAGRFPCRKRIAGSSAPPSTRGASGRAFVAPEGVADLTEALALTHLDIKERGSLLEMIRAGIDIDQAATQSIETLRRDGASKGSSWRIPNICRPSSGRPKSWRSP